MTTNATPTTIDPPACGAVWKNDGMPCVQPKGHGTGRHKDADGYTWRDDDQIEDDQEPSPRDPGEVTDPSDAEVREAIRAYYPETFNMAGEESTRRMRAALRTYRRAPASTVVVPSFRDAVIAAMAVPPEAYSDDELRAILAAHELLSGKASGEVTDRVVRGACPKCSKRHADEGEWATRPHHTHRCVDDIFGNGCGEEWRDDAPLPVSPMCTVPAPAILLTEQLDPSKNGLYRMGVDVRAAIEADRAAVRASLPMGPVRLDQYDNACRAVDAKTSETSGDDGETYCQAEAPQEPGTSPATSLVANVERRAEKAEALLEEAYRNLQAETGARKGAEADLRAAREAIDAQLRDGITLQRERDEARAERDAARMERNARTVERDEARTESVRVGRDLAQALAGASAIARDYDALRSSPTPPEVRRLVEIATPIVDSMVVGEDGDWRMVASVETDG